MLRMKLHTWLDEKTGRCNAMAKHFDVSAAAISQWRKNGVPRSRMLAVRDFTKGKVKIEEMIPVPAESTAS